MIDLPQSTFSGGQPIEGTVTETNRGEQHAAEEPRDVDARSRRGEHDVAVALDVAVVAERVARGELVRVRFDETPVDPEAIARLQGELRDREARRRERLAHRRSR